MMTNELTEIQLSCLDTLTSIQIVAMESVFEKSHKTPSELIDFLKNPTDEKLTQIIQLYYEIGKVINYYIINEELVVDSFEIMPYISQIFEENFD